MCATCFLIYILVNICITIKRKFSAVQKISQLKLSNTAQKKTLTEMQSSFEPFFSLKKKILGSFSYFFLFKMMALSVLSKLSVLLFFFYESEEVCVYTLSNCQWTFNLEHENHNPYIETVAKIKQRAIFHCDVEIWIRYALWNYGVNV